MKTGSSNGLRRREGELPTRPVPRLSIEAGEQRRIYQVLGEELTLGGGEGADIRIVGAGLDPEHVRVVHQDEVLSLQCVEPGRTFIVEGEERPSAELRHDEVVDLGAVRLTFLYDIPRPRRRPPTETEEEPRVRSRRRPAQKGMPTWAVMSCIAVSVFAVGAFILQSLGGSGGGQTAEDYLELARQQWERGDSARALGSLKLAEERGAIGFLTEIRALRSEIRGSLRTKVDSVVVKNGRTDLLSILNVEERYLRAGQEHRPAARELMRQIAQWRAMYAGQASTSPELAGVQQQVEALASKYGPMAAMNEADEPDDVLFAARWRMRLRPRRLWEAIAMLEAWLEANGSHPEIESVRDQSMREGVRMMEERLRLIDMLILRREFERARSHADELAPLAVKLQREAELQSRRAQLEGR